MPGTRATGGLAVPQGTARASANVQGFLARHCHRSCWDEPRPPLRLLNVSVEGANPTTPSAIASLPPAAQAKFACDVSLREVRSRVRQTATGRDVEVASPRICRSDSAGLNGRCRCRPRTGSAGQERTEASCTWGALRLSIAHRHTSNIVPIRGVQWCHCAWQQARPWLSAMGGHSCLIKRAQLPSPWGPWHSHAQDVGVSCCGAPCCSRVFQFLALLGHPA